MPSTVTPSASPSSTSTSVSFYTTTLPSALDDLNSSEQVIDDGDLAVVYSGTWMQNLSEDGVPSKTSHSTQTKDSSLVVTFTGTGIDVLGVTHIGSTNISATYSIDGGTAQTLPVTGANIGIADQTYFSIAGLENKQHTLKIVVGEGVGHRFYTIDCFVVTSAGAGATSPSTSPTSASLTTGSASATTTGTAAIHNKATLIGQSLTLTTTLDMSSILPTPEPSPSVSAASSAESSPVDPNSPAQLSASSDRHMSKGQIAGTVIGTLIGMTILIALLLTFCRWRAIRKRKLPADLDTTPSPLFTSQTESRPEGSFRNEKSFGDIEELSPPQYSECIAQEMGYSGYPYRQEV